MKDRDCDVIYWFPCPQCDSETVEWDNECQCKSCGWSGSIIQLNVMKRVADAKQRKKDGTADEYDDFTLAESYEDLAVAEVLSRPPTG